MSEPADTPPPPIRPLLILGRIGPGDQVEPYAEPIPCLAEFRDDHGRAEH
jgi:hypothetical protein